MGTSAREGRGRDGVEEIRGAGPSPLSNGKLLHTLRHSISHHPLIHVLICRV